MAAGNEREYWGNGGKRVQELDTDEDSDTQGAGLISTRGSRFSSDPLRFTGIDMGDSMPRPRRNHAYGQAGEDYSSNSEQDTELDEEGYAQFAREEEEALVDSAMRRIRRAQASGKKDVKLSKKELAALENHRKRQIEGESKKKKKREQRYAVPLSQLAPTSQKENRTQRVPGALPSTESLPRQAAQPPVGWFAHPSSSRPGSSDSRRPASNRTSDREGSTSPFQYNYVRPMAPVSNPRHLSDPSVRPRSGSTRGNLPYPDTRMSPYNPSSSAPSVPSTLDPFRYMTSGPSAPYHAGSAASLRNISGSSMGAGHYEPSTRGGASAPRRKSRHFTPDDGESSSEDSENEDEDETSDEADAGARIGNSNTTGREEIIVEVAREPTPEPRVTRSKKATPSAQGSPRSSPKATPKRRNTIGSRKKKGSK